MAGKKKKAISGGKSIGAGRSSQREAAKSFVPWLPFVSWLTGAIVVTYLLFVFYNPSPTISAAYFVIVAVGGYILWRSKKYVRKGKGQE